MVADRIIPIKYNSLLGYENQPYEDNYYHYYQREETIVQSFLASTEVIPLGWIGHHESRTKNDKSASNSLPYLKKKKKMMKMNSKDLRREKRKLLFQRKMMSAHYNFEESELMMREADTSDVSVAAFMLVMVRKDTSSMYHDDIGEEYFEGVCNYKIALMNMRKFRMVTDLEDFIFLDLEYLDGQMKKYLELEGEFSRRNHYLVSFENDQIKLEEENHIVKTGLFTFMSEGMIVQFRLILDRLLITNTRVLVEKYLKNSPLERSFKFMSGKIISLNNLFTDDRDLKSTALIVNNNNELVLFDLENVHKKVFPLPPVLDQHSRKAIISCELQSHSGIYMISNSEIFSIGSSNGSFKLDRDEILSNNLSQHLNHGYQLGEICKLTETKYLILLEKSNIDLSEEITLVGLFENSKWIIVDLYSKTVVSTEPTMYKTRNSESLEEGFTTVSKKRGQQPRRFVTNYGGELNGGMRSEIEKLNLPKFAINKRNMYSYRPFRNNPDCFLVKTFLTSSKVENQTFDYLKAEILPVAHFSLCFHIKEEAIFLSRKSSDERLFSDLEIKLKS